MTPGVTGPVVITGADGHVGRALRARLDDVPNVVRPLGRDDDPGSACADAEVVVHLAGTLQAVHGNSYQDANVGTVRRTVRALEGSLVRRLVFLSYVGADAASANQYLATKGHAEEIVRGGPVGSVIVRSTFIYGPPEDPGPSALPFLTSGGSVSVIGTGNQRWAPVYVEDVVEALTRAALDPGVPTGTFALAGPEALTVDAFVEALNRRHVKERHLSGRIARAVAHLVPTLTPTMVEVLEADSLPDGPLISDVLDLELHKVSDVYPVTA
jgi:NADH dehydrogenase